MILPFRFVLLIHGGWKAVFEALKQRGIFYAPDFVINGGGVINAAAEVDGPYDKEAVLVKVDGIYDSIEHILSESKKTGEPEGVIATRYAESIIYK